MVHLSILWFADAMVTRKLNMIQFADSCGSYLCYVIWCIYRHIDLKQEMHVIIQPNVGLVVSMSDHEVAGSIPGTSTNFKFGIGLERGPPRLVSTIG